MKKIFFWLNCSRLFSLPMTVMSWLVVFIYGFMDGGNIFGGILALVGISFAHLATNLFDDYVDYRLLTKDEKIYKAAHKNKCKYIFDGSASLDDLLKVVSIYCSIAFIIGLSLVFMCGWWVMGLALIGGLITLFYAGFSIVGLSEIAVGIAFGPLLFEGVYFVMTGNFSWDVFLLSLAVVMFTIGLLYTHNLLDYDGDICADKKTLCCRIKDKNKALKILGAFYIFGYFMVGVLALKSSNWHLFFTYLTIPLAIQLFKSMDEYNIDKTSVPKLHWWNYPIDNRAQIEEEGNAAFYFRLYQARNLMMYFALILSLSLMKLH